MYLVILFLLTYLYLLSFTCFSSNWPGYTLFQWLCKWNKNCCHCCRIVTMNSFMFNHRIKEITALSWILTKTWRVYIPTLLDIIKKTFGAHYNNITHVFIVSCIPGPNYFLFNFSLKNQYSKKKSLLLSSSFIDKEIKAKGDWITCRALELQNQDSSTGSVFLS